ncbi:MAG: hypothetical protein H0V17_08490, partial [Deltaproteobacteria bacterium]|nr:hypothetical protein [Deltaproteobacteria bacterium]
MRVCLVALIVAAGCEQARLDDPVPIPIPPPIPIDPLVGCRADSDCEVFVGCCAHCSPTGAVISLNKAYTPVAALLTLTFYCPMCAEGGCNTRAPQRTAICKRGTCARRDVTFADDVRTVATSVE